MRITQGFLAVTATVAVWAAVDPSWMSIPALALSVWMTVRWLRTRPWHNMRSLREFFTFRSASAKQVTRTGEKARQRDGLASAAQVRRHGGRGRVRKLAPVVRPSMAGAGTVQRLRTPTSEVGIRLCRVGRRWVWASLEDVVLYFAGTRRGKSGWLASTTVDFPGPVVVTTTRVDDYRKTLTHRARVGDVLVFNATGLALPDTIIFDPLHGCESPVIAAERCADMIPTAPHSEQEHWAALARSALASLMHAAALGGHSMDVVSRWVADPAKAQAAVVPILHRSPAKAVVAAAEQFFGTNDRTQTSITTSIQQALSWLQAPSARTAAGLDGADGPLFTIDALLSGRNTLYILGRKEDNVAPLMSALTGYVAREARRAANGHRLDPPLGLHLDEAGLLRPPLADWSADMGGSGISIVACLQSRAQLISAWGAADAAVIINNAGSIVLGGGTKDPDDLQAWSKLVGQRDQSTASRDRNGKVTSTQQRQVEVVAASQLAHMTPKTCLLFGKDMPPAVGRVRMVWERPDVRWERWMRRVENTRSRISSLRPTSTETAQTPAVVDVVETPTVEEPARV